MFTHEQNAELGKPLNGANVKSRQQAGRSLSYIEGWKAVEEANRIFGFDGWTRETVDIRCVSEREREIGTAKRPGWGVSYIAKVRIIVGTITREGVGAGHGIDVDLGQAHESAIKEAETDAMKRALMTFGYPFGLALYDKQQEHVTNGEVPAKSTLVKAAADGAAEYVAQGKTAIASFQNEKALRTWWANEKPNRDKFKLNPDKGPGSELMFAYGDRRAEFQSDNVMAG
jgi:DNA repair and recombination protein RAD52